jgi:uncharacterized protein YecT (DUF1311 family)
MTWFLSPSTVWAAGFYCPDAKTPFDKFICAESKVSFADDTLTSIYRGVIDADDSGKNALRESQRAWLAKLHHDCPIAPQGDVKEERSCLLNAYAERTKALVARWREITLAKANTLQAGPYKFKLLEFTSQKETYHGWNGEQLDKDMAGKSTMTISYPVIVSPINSSTKSWNEATAPSDKDFEDQCGDGASSQKLIQTVALASNRLLGLVIESEYRCSGANQPLAGRETKTYLMGAQIRLISPGDFFAGNKPWKDILAKKGAEILDDDRAVRYFRQAIDNMSAWQITPHDLHIVYGSNPLSLPTDYVSIPWSEIRSVLLPKAPIPGPHDYFVEPGHE